MTLCNRTIPPKQTHSKFFCTCHAVAVIPCFSEENFPLMYFSPTNFRFLHKGSMGLAMTDRNWQFKNKYKPEISSLHEQKIFLYESAILPFLDRLVGECLCLRMHFKYLQHLTLLIPLKWSRPRFRLHCMLSVYLCNSYMKVKPLRHPRTCEIPMIDWLKWFS